MAGYDWREAVIKFNEHPAVCKEHDKAPEQWSTLKHAGVDYFFEVALGKIMLAAEAGVLPDTLHEIFDSEADFGVFCEDLSASEHRLVTDRVFVALEKFMPNWMDGDQENGYFCNDTISILLQEKWAEEEGGE